MPTPTTHAQKTDITSQATAQARSMAGLDPTHSQPGCPAAAALRAHSTLSAALGHSIPFTALGPTGAEVHGLAAFLAVYATQARH
ncbi:hypothetical protein [Streptomyces sp. NPDC093544]|jgi:hypothetical protein|uniref:hypothetical protein n=1 Tax=Streptomyces sp. NPDC093544 TaxID=3155200 RepID=UPI003419D26B